MYTKLDRFENPNWPKAHQLAIYKCCCGFEPGTTKNKCSKWSGHYFSSATLPLVIVNPFSSRLPYLLMIKSASFAITLSTITLALMYTLTIFVELWYNIL